MMFETRWYFEWTTWMTQKEEIVWGFSAPIGQVIDVWLPADVETFLTTFAYDFGKDVTEVTSFRASWYEMLLVTFCSYNLFFLLEQRALTGRCHMTVGTFKIVPTIKSAMALHWRLPFPNVWHVQHRVGFGVYRSTQTLYSPIKINRRHSSVKTWQVRI